MTHQIFQREGFVIILTSNGTLYINIGPFIDGVYGSESKESFRTLLGRINIKSVYSHDDIDPSHKLYGMMRGREANYYYIRSHDAFRGIDVALTYPTIFPKAKEFKPKLMKLLTDIRLETI